MVGFLLTRKRCWMKMSGPFPSNNLSGSPEVRRSFVFCSQKDVRAIHQSEMLLFDSMQTFPALHLAKGPFVCHIFESKKPDMGCNISKIHTGCLFSHHWKNTMMTVRSQNSHVAPHCHACRIHERELGCALGCIIACQQELGFALGCTIVCQWFPLKFYWYWLPIRDPNFFSKKQTPLKSFSNCCNLLKGQHQQTVCVLFPFIHFTLLSETASRRKKMIDSIKDVIFLLLLFCYD